MADERRLHSDDECMAYMYILECSDRTLYVGSTRDLEHRVAQHNNGEGAIYTQSRLPVRLLYFEQFDRVDDAYRREKQVQGWGRAKRLALVHGRLDRLPPLAKKRFSKVTGVSRETSPRRATDEEVDQQCSRTPASAVLA